MSPPFTLLNNTDESYIIEYVQLDMVNGKWNVSAGQRVDPGQTVELLGYKPGRLIFIRPLNDARKPRE